MKKLMCAVFVLGLFLLGYGPILGARASVAQKPLNAVVEPIFTVHRGGCQVLQDQFARLQYELEVSRNFLTDDFGQGLKAAISATVAKLHQQIVQVQAKLIDCSNPGTPTAS